MYLTVEEEYIVFPTVEWEKVLKIIAAAHWVKRTQKVGYPFCFVILIYSVRQSLST